MKGTEKETERKRERKVGVVAFAFGAPAEIESNEIIAEIALKKAKEVGATIFTQYDVSLGENFDVVRPNEIMNCPPTTYELAFKAVEWAEEFKINELWIVAAPCHQHRCERDIKYILWLKNKDLEVNVQVCDEAKNFTEWFSRKSMYWWTRSPLLWWLRELPLLFTPMYFYKKMTTSD